MPAHQAISLYCTSGGSDKVYHIQLISSGATWSVIAQSGKRGSTLINRNKLLGATYGAAKACYDKLVDEKVRIKFYVSGALSLKGREALAATPAAPPEPPAAPLPPLPTWPDLAIRYAEIATLLKEPSAIKTKPQAHIVLLVDLSDGAEGGLPDAVAMVNKAALLPTAAARAKAVTALFSAEGFLWFNAVDTSGQALALSKVNKACSDLTRVL